MSLWRRTRWTLAPLAVMLLVAAGCTNDNLDDGDSPDVVLEVEALENPPVTASLDDATGICTFTVGDWRFSAFNLPKNLVTEGSSPYNDITMISVAVTYSWINPNLSTQSRTFGLGGVVVPVGGTGEVAFQPIALDDLQLAYSGSTANLVLVFRARTVEGTTISTTVGRTLNVASCQ